MNYMLAKPTSSDSKSVVTSVVGITDIRPDQADLLSNGLGQAMSSYDVARNDTFIQNSPAGRRTDAAHSAPTATGSSLVWKCDVDRVHGSQLAVGENRDSVPVVINNLEIAKATQPASTAINPLELQTPENHRITSAQQAVDRPATANRVQRVRPGIKFSEHQPSVGAEVESNSTSKWRHLVAESAHEVRAPLAVASQLIKVVQTQLADPATNVATIRANLAIAEGRIQQASQWSENILTWRRLSSGWPLPIRKRFYPDQWRMTVEPVLNGLAQSRNVNLEWIGWDRSLPRLYLDPTHLARVVINLVGNGVEASRSGQTISIRVHWQSNLVHRLIIAIEDSAKGMRQELIDYLNGPHWALPALTAKVSNGLGLQNAKQLSMSLGGTLHAQITADGGTSIRISLPVDQRESLLRSWLEQQIRIDTAARSEDLHTPGSMTRKLKLFAIKYAEDATKLNSFLSDSIQKQGTSHDLVYNVSYGRWIWLTIGDDRTHQRIADSLKRGTDVLFSGPRESAPWLIQLCRSWPWESQSIHNSAVSAEGGTPSRLSAMVHQVARTMEELMGDQVAPTDSLTAADDDLIYKSIGNSNSRTTFRVDRSAATIQPPKVQAPRLKPRRVGDVSVTSAQANITRVDQQSAANQRQALSMIATGWHNQHSQLARTTRTTPII